MKSLLSLMAALALAGSLAACTAQSTAQSVDQASSASQEPVSSSSDSLSKASSTSAEEDGWRTLNEEETLELMDKLGASEINGDGKQTTWAAKTEDNRVGISFAKDTSEKDGPAARIGIYETDNSKDYLIDKITTDDGTRYRISFSKIYIFSGPGDNEPAGYEAITEGATGIVIDVSEIENNSIELISFVPEMEDYNGNPEIMPGVLYAG